MSMTTVFGHSTRMLLCERCGAPLEVSTAGGQTSCRSCNAVHQIAARNEPRIMTAAQSQAPLSEQERIARLKSQDGKPWLPPPSLAALVPNGQLQPWKVQEALAVWQSTRQELSASSSFEAAERLLFLTVLLSNHYSKEGDPSRQRALFESALEAFTLPRHRQIMHGYLSRCASREGDLQAAEEWLAPCETRADDLETDTAYRVSRAYLDTAKAQYNDVLNVLGKQPDQVPIMDAMDPLAMTLQANAWERLNNMAAAIDVLKAAMAKGPQIRMTIGKIIEYHAPLRLCPQSYAQAQQAHNADAANSVGAGAGVGLFLTVVASMLLTAGILWAILTVALSTQPLEFMQFIGPIIFVWFSLPLLSVALKAKKKGEKAKRLQMHGIPATGRVINAQRTGASINRVPEMRIRIQVELPGRAPHEADATLYIAPEEMHKLTAGTAVSVRVDPDDPSSIMLEAS